MGRSARTAHDLLKEQLVLLDTRMKDVVTSVHEGETDALVESVTGRRAVAGRKSLGSAS